MPQTQLEEATPVAVREEAAMNGGSRRSAELDAWRCLVAAICSRPKYLRQGKKMYLCTFFSDEYMADFIKIYVFGRCSYISAVRCLIMNNCVIILLSWQLNKDLINVNFILNYKI